MKRWSIIAGMVAILTIIGFKSRPAPALLSGRAMGCEWKLHAQGRWDPPAVRSEIAAVLEEWEQVLSTWRVDSDLSRYNRGEPASPKLLQVLEMAEDLRRDSHGAFDHRMLAHLTTAGFGPGGKGVDLSSLGKGIAVDAVCERLQRRGIHYHVFSLAGEVRAGKGKWPVIIENPDPTRETGGETMITLSGNAMATSGNYRQWNHKEGGKLASHILDPTTGRSIILKRKMGVLI